MTRAWVGRALVVAASTALLVMLTGAPASADPAAPTDYESEVVGIEPPVPTIEARVVGGDSFVQLRVERGTEVFVVGYQGEDYLWFRTDGVVLENRNSPTTYVNESRYGTEPVPEGLDAATEPSWHEVATGGSWVWHDHRAHWMQQSRPVGFAPGDRILDASIELRVDDEAVEVNVVSTWLPAPSPIPVWFGAGVGLVAAGATWSLRRHGRSPMPVVAGTAGVALLVGAWQFWSLPAQTDPRAVWVVVPAIAVVCSVVGLVVGLRTGPGFTTDAAQLVVGVELAVWGAVKRDGWSAALIPTAAPDWLDRAVTAMAVTGGVAFAAIALWSLFAAGSRPEPLARSVSGSRAPSDSRPPAHP